MADCLESRLRGLLLSRKPRAQTIISEAVKEYAYPVAFGLPVGHIPNNYPLPLGVEAKLTVGEKSSNLVYMD